MMKGPDPKKDYSFLNKVHCLQLGEDFDKFAEKPGVKWSGAWVPKLGVTFKSRIPYLPGQKFCIPPGTPLRVVDYDVEYGWLYVVATPGVGQSDIRVYVAGCDVAQFQLPHADTATVGPNVMREKTLKYLKVNELRALGEPCDPQCWGWFINGETGRPECCDECVGPNKSGVLTMTDDDAFNLWMDEVQETLKTLPKGTLKKLAHLFPTRSDR